MDFDVDFFVVFYEVSIEIRRRFAFNEFGFMELVMYLEELIFCRGC